VTGRDDAYAMKAVGGGWLEGDGETAVLEFDSGAGPVRLVIPAEQLAALLSVCIGLAGQALPNGGEAEHATIPVSDWRVGVSEGKALILGLAPEAGGALAFHLTTIQAREMASALLRGAELAECGQPRRLRH
jgi:hypothetical protein